MKMTPSKENCSKCPSKDICPVNESETSHKEFTDFLTELLAETLGEPEDSLGKNGPTLYDQIKRLEKGFEEKKALEANSLLTAFVIIDQRLDAIEEKLGITPNASKSDIKH